MSGPKLSVAEIERLRQEQLERERQEALRVLKEAQGVYRKACASIKELKANIKSYSENIFPKVDASLSIQSRNNINALLDQIKVVKIINTKEPSSYTEAAAEINEQVFNAKAEIERLFGKILLRSDKINEADQTDLINQSFQSYITFKGAVQSNCVIDFQCKYDEKMFYNQLKEFLDYMNDLKRSRISDLRMLAEQSIQFYKKNIENRDVWDQRRKVRAYMQEALNTEQEIRREYEAKNNFYDDYLALAASTGIKPKIPDDFISVEELKDEIEKLETIYKMQDEMDFIADQVNDVMISLGYGFVSSKVLKRKDSSEMDVSLYKADNKTGIVVYTSQNGDVMMQLSVLGTGDITESDREFSYQRQLDFCASHPDLVEALRTRGVLLQQKSYCAPDRKYTYKLDENKIVGQSSSDQLMQKGIESTKLNQKKIDRRKRRRAAGSIKMR